MRRPFFASNAISFIVVFSIPFSANNLLATSINIDRVFFVPILSKNFYNYSGDSAQLETLLGIEGDKLRPSKESLISELVDYHGEYHKTMKELFSFNRFWSKDKLFYNSLEKKFAKLKYKNINYYTRNFQRPIVYPFLDYKYRYPSFSKFQMKDDFYISNSKENNEEKIEKIEDDYNFNLECPEFDEMVNRYNIEIFKSIKKNTQSFIEIFNVCRVKQLYHVNGTLFVLRRKHKIKIIFFSYSYDLDNEKENIFQCNKTDKDKDKINNANSINKDDLNNQLFLSYKDKSYYTKFLNTHMINDYFTHEKTKLIVNKKYLVIKSNEEVPLFFKDIDRNEKNLFVCDFINKDYFWLEELV